MKIFKSDIIIIGSGPGAGITASQLSTKTNLKITILEKGKKKNSKTESYSSEEMNNSYYKAGLTACIGKGNLNYATAECLGGGSEINSGFFLKTPKKIIDLWKKKILDINDSQINNIYLQIKKKLNINKSFETSNGSSSRILHSGAKKLKLSSGIAERWIRSKYINKKWKHTRYGMVQTYLKDAKKNGCEIITQCEVQKIKKNKNDLFLVSCIKKNKKIIFQSKYLFLCAGAIGSPFILIKSGIKKNIGKNLKFHLQTRIIAKFSKNINEENFGVPVRQINHFIPKMSFGCSISTKKHLVLWCDNNHHEILSNYKKYSIFYGLVSSNSTGRIYKLPLIDDPIIRYDVSEKDKKNIKNSILLLAKILFAAGAKQIYLPNSDKKDLRNTFVNIKDVKKFIIRETNFLPEISSIHLFSSIPMGKSKSCPLDSYGKLKNYKNLYVNDSSMLPNCTGVNPQATIMIFAKRNVDKFIKNL